MEESKNEIDAIKKQCDEYLDGWKRAKAELANYQKQVEREKTDWFLFSSAECIKAILPVLDSLESAVSSLRDGAQSLSDDDGITKIRDQMLDVLQKMGVEQIKIVGEPVNAEFHESVGIEKSEEHTAGIVLKEVQRGYAMHGKVLRVAKVIVAE